MSIPQICVECYTQIPHWPHTHINQDSPTFPLYTEVMGKGNSKAEEGDGSQPEVPQKQLTQEDLKELNLPTDEEVPSVPQQNLTNEDIQQMVLSIEVLMLYASFLTVNEKEEQKYIDRKENNNNNITVPN